MRSALKILNGRQKSEAGFVLIAAIMAVMIIVALGFFVLTTTSQDLRISARLVGERKAFSAAESGVHEVCRIFDPSTGQPYPDIPWTQIDSVHDPNLQYSINNIHRGDDISSIHLPGFDLNGFCGAVFIFTVVGRDTSYTPDVETSIEVGAAYEGAECFTWQGRL